MNPLFFLLTCFLFAILLGCQNSADEKDFFLSDSTSITGLTGDSVKLVKTAALDFKVKDVEQGTLDISLLTRMYGGMIFNQHLQSVEEGRKELKISVDSMMVITAYRPGANITIRIPSTHLEEFMYGIADIGYYTGSSQLNIDDKSLVYLQNALKQKERRTVFSYPASQKSDSSAVKAIAIKDEAIDREIANMSIDADVAYSTVTLRVFQNTVVRKEVIANYVLSDYNLPFTNRLGNAVNIGWRYFLELILALAHLWVFLLLGAISFAGYKYWQQKRKLTVLNIKARTS